MPPGQRSSSHLCEPRNLLPPLSRGLIVPGHWAVTGTALLPREPWLPICIQEKGLLLPCDGRGIHPAFWEGSLSAPSQRWTVQSLCPANPRLGFGTAWTFPHRDGGGGGHCKVAMARNINTPRIHRCFSESRCTQRGGNYIVVHMHYGALCSCENSSEVLYRVTVMGRHDIPDRGPCM